MFRIIIGILIGMAIFIAFIYMGGADFIKDLGKETKKVERSIKKIERDAREKVDRVGDAVGDMSRGARDKAREVGRQMKKIEEKLTREAEDMEELDRLLEKLDSEEKDE